MSSRTLFIRDRQNKTLADIEITDKDVTVALCCKAYSEFLLISVGFPYCSSDDATRARAARCIAFFEAVSELRGWYYEQQQQQS